MVALYRWRWPNGFVCPRCEHTGHCRVQSRGLYQCSGCRYQVSLTAGTILASTKLALRTWFLAMYLLTQTKNGISALGAVAATGGELQHGLEGQAQADAGDEGARRHVPFVRLGAAR